ncbi:MAG: protein kinase [Planctomycetaceae bacterium]
MSSQRPDAISIFKSARKIDSGSNRSAYLASACGDDSGLREKVDKLLAEFAEESQPAGQSQPGFEKTVIPDSTSKKVPGSLNVGLTANSCEEAAVVLSHTNHSVLNSISASLSDVPAVMLRDATEFDDRVVQPLSNEIPIHPSRSRIQLHGEIARGGMGAVLRGRDTDLGRDLAIKVLLNSHKDKPDVVQRFIEEAQIGGQLQHPGIAPVYELGQLADERPFFSMKLVKGDTLSKLLSDREEPATDRAKLIGIFEQVCQTMEYANSRGVIHRDLKTANIMVGAFGEVQVMDWGLAKVLSAGGVADERTARKKQNGETLIQTMRSVGSDVPGTVGSIGAEPQMGSVMGTPAFMPPEQALGEIDILDQRTDVFGLGAILAEILTGKPPYVADDGNQIFRMASRGKLGDCFTRLDECGADEELVSLAKQCLELEPVDRPKDASALADQVTGYLESVETKLRTAEVERAGEAARVVEQRKRFRVTLWLGAAALSILLMGIAGTAWQALEASKQTLVAHAAQKEATTERDHALESEEEAVKAKETAERAQTVAEEARLREKEIARQRRRELYAADMQLADQLYNGQNGEQQRIEQLLASWIPVDDQENLREFSWRHQWTRLYKSAAITVPGCVGVAVTPDGKMVVADSSGLHEVHEGGEKRERIKWKLDQIHSYFSCDGRWVASRFEAGIELYNIQSGEKVLSLPLERCSFSANGKYFAAWKKGAKVDSLSPDEDAIPVWKLDGENAVPIEPLNIGSMRKLPNDGFKLKIGSDGKSFLLRNNPGVVNPWGVGAFLNGNPEPVIWQHRSPPNCTWSPDGRIIASTVGGSIELRLTSDVAERRTLDKLAISTHGKHIRTIRFSPDGKLIATGGSDGTIDLWDVSELATAAERFENQDRETSGAADSKRSLIQSVPRPRLIRTIKAYTTPVSILDSALNFSADGAQLVSLAYPRPGVAKLWKLDRDPGEYQVDNITDDLYGWIPPVGSRPSEIRGLDWFIGKTRPGDIVTGSPKTEDRIAAIFDPENGGWFTVDGPDTWAEFAILRVGSLDSTVRLKLVNPDGEQHEVTLRRQRRILDQSPRSFSVAFAPDGNSAMLSDYTLGATRLNLKTEEAIRYPQRGLTVAYSPDGRLVAIDDMYSVSIREIETNKELYRLDSIIDSNWNTNTWGGHLTFSPDGKYLAHVSSYRYNSTRSNLNVWRTSDFKKIGGGPLHQEDFSMKSPVFSPDSSRLLVGDFRGRVQIWDTSDWSKQEPLLTAQLGLVSMAVSSDGKRLVTGYFVPGGGVCVWDLETRQKLRKFSSPPVGWLALSPDDRTLAVGSFDHNVVLWDMETGNRLQTIQAHPEEVNGVAFSQDGTRLATLSIDGVLRIWDAASNEAIERDPNTLMAMFRLGLWRFEQKRYEDAAALFSKVVELNRQSGRPIDSELKSVQWKIRKTLRQAGRWPKGVQCESKFAGVRLGKQATLSVQPIKGEWTYQWYCNYEPVEGATNPTLTLPKVTADQIGTYQVKIAPPGYESVTSHLAGDAYVYDASNPVIPGTLFCEIFQNIKGKTVEDLTSSRQYQNRRWGYSRSLKTFEAPPNDIGSFGDNYGIRVTGFIKPPKTGDYVFYLASDDEGELYLSSDESPDNLELVAAVKRGPSGIGNESGRTNKRAWGANPSAVSKSIHLEAGKRYSVKALMKEDSGQDYLSVTWQMPGNPPPKPGAPPMPGEYLEFEVKQK